MTRVCKSCGETKPMAAFNRDRGRKNGRDPRCKACRLAYARSYYAKNRERMLAYTKSRPEARGRPRRDRNLRRVHGLSADEADALLAAQGGRCAACGTDRFNARGPHIDHDHGTGKIRGMICHSCNTGIGLLGDSVGGIAAALNYLQRGLPASEGWAVQ